MSAASAVIQVCTGCKDPDAARRRDGIGGGPAMLASIAALAGGYAPPAGSALAVRGYACLGNCRRRCRLSIAAAGRWSWLVGDLGPDDDLAPLRGFLDAWFASPDGAVPTPQRPPAIRRKLIGRIAPLA